MTGTDDDGSYSRRTPGDLYAVPDITFPSESITVEIDGKVVIDHGVPVGDPPSAIAAFYNPGFRAAEYENQWQDDQPKDRTVVEFRSAPGKHREAAAHAETIMNDLVARAFEPERRRDAVQRLAVAWAAALVAGGHDIGEPGVVDPLIEALTTLGVTMDEIIAATELSDHDSVAYDLGFMPRKDV